MHPRKKKLVFSQSKTGFKLWKLGTQNKSCYLLSVVLPTCARPVHRHFTVAGNTLDKDILSLISSNLSPKRESGPCNEGVKNKRVLFFFLRVHRLAYIRATVCFYHRSSSQAYDSSVKLMLCWTTATTLLTVGGAAWR